VPENFNDLAIVEDALAFSVSETGEMRKEYTGGWAGLIRPKMAWKTEFLNS
jgi:lipopolysaccharide transport system ATP-binding protein